LYLARYINYLDEFLFENGRQVEEPEVDELLSLDEEFIFGLTQLRMNIFINLKAPTVIGMLENAMFCTGKGWVLILWL